jgi:hypothetical protein
MSVRDITPQVLKSAAVSSNSCNMRASSLLFLAIANLFSMLWIWRLGHSHPPDAPAGLCILCSI